MSYSTSSLKKHLPEPNDVLYRIKRGLSGYVSYLAACEMNRSFSEYLLYEPILRILTARGFKVDCEVECPGVRQPVTGDKKRLDFVVHGNTTEFAMEVKWAKRRQLDLRSDIEKLSAWHRTADARRAFLCVFGTESCIRGFEAPEGFREQGRQVIADFGRTKFGCRIYELAKAQSCHKQ